MAGKTHDLFYENWRALTISVLEPSRGLCDLCRYLICGPAIVNWFQDGTIELIMYLRGTGDKSMMTSADADLEGSMGKYIHASENATYKDFMKTYQKQPGLFYTSILSGAAYKDVLKVVAKGVCCRVYDGRFLDDKENSRNGDQEIT